MKREARQEVAEAERTLEELQRSRRAGEDARAAAERAVRRASVLAHDAADGVSRQRERLRVALSDRVALRAEADGLAVDARAVAA